MFCHHCVAILLDDRYTMGYLDVLADDNGIKSGGYRWRTGDDIFLKLG